MMTAALDRVRRIDAETTLEIRKRALEDERALARAEQEALLSECRALRVALQGLVGTRASVVGCDALHREDPDCRNADELQV